MKNYSYDIYCIHADASMTGGQDAVEKACELVAAQGKRTIVTLGDFNCDVNRAKQIAKKRANLEIEVGLDAGNKRMRRTHESGQVLDYVIIPKKADIAAVMPKRGSIDLLATNTSDHSPIIYSFG